MAAARDPMDFPRPKWLTLGQRVCWTRMAPGRFFEVVRIDPATGAFHLLEENRPGQKWLRFRLQDWTGFDPATIETRFDRELLV